MEKAFYHLNTMYSVTFNPNNNYQYYNKLDRHILVKNLYNEVLSKGLVRYHNIKYKLYIEISEPRGFAKNKYDGPRVHLHGTVKFLKLTDLKYFLLYQYRAICKIGTLDIDTIKDKSHWHKYCTKQKILSIHPISL